MNNEEEKRCPLCAEEMDWTDQQLNPCKCGYEVCVWCWHHIMDMAEKDATEGRCPACRSPYDKDRIVGLEAKFERVAANSSSRKQKLSKAKAKPNEGRKELSNVRVIQRKMAYIIGLPLDLADEELLQQKDYFGQYGKVTKVSLSRTAGGAVQQFINDTCSVYITYSKEEEAVICIQSVHGYVLDGRLLRASFGTAKYCHAWLRNTPCNNPTCLYLHTVGAEEDSFGKDEVAAVHTRNRVEEIVGGTRYLHRRSGSMLPPPVIEKLNIQSDSAHEPVCSNDLKEVPYPSVASGDHLPCSKEKDGTVRSSKHTATFVDIVGRSCNSGSGSNKDANSVERADVNRDENSKEQLATILIDSPTFDDQRSKDPVGSSHMGSFVPSYPVKTTTNGSDRSWWNSEHHDQISVSRDTIHSYSDEHNTIPSAHTSSVMNDGYNEKKFQSSAKSDRIYRCSNSFSNEDVVEHLRRLDHDTIVNNDDNSAAVESSIISNILSMDLDGSDNSAFSQKVAGLFEGRDGRHGSSRSFQNIVQSRFSFANEHGQQNELGSPSNIGQELSFSVLQDSSESKDSIYKSQHHASRSHNLTPPGFSMHSKPPPGFSSYMRTEQVVSASSGSYFRAMPNTQYRSSSLGNLSNSSDEPVDPAIMAGGGKSPTIGSTNSWTSSFASQCSTSFDEDTKHWHVMRQQAAPSADIHHHRQEPQFSRATMQQHHAPQFPSSQDNLYGSLTSGLTDLHNQSYNTSLFTQQPRFASGYQQHNHLQDAQQHDPRSEVERYGLDSFLPGYGDNIFQMPTSGDVYTRVFGM